MGNWTEHKVMSDFQPFGSPRELGPMIFGTVLNWAALYGVFYVIGTALRHGLGL